MLFRKKWEWNLLDEVRRKLLNGKDKHF